MPLRFGAFTFDAQRRELRRDGESLQLSPKAFLLLELLIGARPNPVPRDTLYQRLWPDVVVEPGNLHGLISEIRTTLDDRDHAIVRTVHRVGYAFVAAGILEDTARFSILIGDEEIPLRSGENGIGRDPRDTIVIHSPDVSRHHARLTVTGTTITLEDLGSKNGTFLGTRAVTEAVQIAPGDEILIGTIRLRLVRVDALAPTATAT
ncbi:MAG TPA: FHA domain-containing protein [Thermoanaerobaculia bacterium]|jgi:DNA-binding winged helix-turn-helix (wHTH) protein|nr:FHA domain-containing protein [Thermoanaerobaculia bacterium]